MPDEPADDPVEPEICCWSDGPLDDPEEVGGASDEPLDGLVGGVLADGLPDCALSEMRAGGVGEPSAGELGDRSSDAVSDALPGTTGGIAAVSS